ncbi:unnamed protein product [Cuscuta campestris]|uniref:Uncharacterized protein n=1 Tax=Cuscuta campestris TaxID=132261 RepID=A0A484MUU3_9ASTE|nr:unnamed protein product [Cuscuta campestris]
MAFHDGSSTRERAIPAGDLIQRHVETDLTTGTAVGDSAIHTRGGTNLQTELTAELVSTAGFSDQYSSGGGHRGSEHGSEYRKGQKEIAKKRECGEESRTRAEQPNPNPQIKPNSKFNITNHTIQYSYSRIQHQLNETSQ